MTLFNVLSVKKQNLFLPFEIFPYLCTRIGEVAEWSIAAVLKTVVLRGTGGSNPSLSAEPTGQKRTVRGQKPTNQRFVGFFIAYKSCFQDNKRTVKDIVSLLNRYLFPTGQKR